jgi:hypothetical protein
MGQADDDGVPPTAFTVTALGVGGGMAGHLHQSLGPPLPTDSTRKSPSGSGPRWRALPAFLRWGLAGGPV